MFCIRVFENVLKMFLLLGIIMNGFILFDFSFYCVKNDYENYDYYKGEEKIVLEEIMWKV